MASSWSSNKGDFKKEPKQIFSSSGMYQSNPGRSGQGSSGGTSESPPSASETADFNNDFYKKPENEAETSLRRRKTQIANDSIDKLQKLTQIMNSTLASLNLPAALEDLSRSKVHQLAVEKAQQMKDIGGIDFLTTEMNELSVFFQRSQKILEECIKMIHNEEKADKDCRERFKERWTQTASAELTQSMKDENKKCKQMLETEINAYNNVQEKFEKHKQAIELLSKSTEEIDKVLFSTGGTQVSKDREVVKELRKLMEEVVSIKAEREGLEKLFKETLTPTADNDKMTELDLGPGPSQQQVIAIQKKQESVMSQIKKASEALEASDQSETKQWESVLKDLAAGFDRSMEIKSYIEDYEKLYSELTQFLDRQQKKISDFCFTREKEKEELLNKLQKSDASYLSKNQGDQPKKPAQGPGRMTSSLLAKGARSKTGMDYFINRSWTSERIPVKKKEPVNFYDYCKWSFLLQNVEPRKKIDFRLKKMNTDIICEIKEAEIDVNFLSNTPFKGDSEFDHWKYECFRIVDEVLSDLLLITIECSLEATKLFREIVSEKFSSAVKIVEQNSSVGVCFVGGGESLVTIIADIWKRECFKYTKFWETETNQEISIRSIDLDDNRSRCWKLFDMKEKVTEEFPTVKIYASSEGASLKLIGNSKDVRLADNFINTSIWLYFHHQETKFFDREVIEFLSQKVVKKFIDGEIKKAGMGTFILSIEKNSLDAYSVDDKKVKTVMETICKSFYDHAYQIAVVRKQEEKIHRFQKRATELKDRTNGKFSMHIGNIDKAGAREVRILYTNDLCNNSDIVRLVDDIKQEEVRHDQLEFSPEVIQFLRKMEKEIVERMQNIFIEFADENALKLKGDEASILALKNYIDGMKLGQRAIFLPQSLTMNQGPEKLCKEPGCLFIKMQSNPESKVWYLNNIVIMVYQGEPRKDLFIDLQANLIFSDRDRKDTSSLSKGLGGQRVLTVTIPTKYERKGKHSAHESFEEAYNTVLQFKMRSILIPIKTEENWPTKRLVKALLFPLMQLRSQEVITVILSSREQKHCKAVNEVIQTAIKKNAHTSKKDQSERIKYEVQTGELAKQTADVIVNTISDDLDLTNGAVSSSIWKAAHSDSKLQEELKKKNRNKERAEHGELLETESFGLPCKKIFHGALVEWKSISEDSEKIMQTFVTSCLEKANKHEFSTLAFPALGTGVLKFPPDVVAKLMKEAVRKFENNHPDHTIKKIIFVIFYKDDKNFKAFQEIFMKEDENEVGIEEMENLPDFTGGNGLEEVVICGREEDVKKVVEKLNQRLLENFSAQSVKTNLEEPGNQEMTNRNGTESSDGLTASVDQTYDANKNAANKESMKEFDDTKHCKIAIFKDKKALYENPTILKTRPRAIICPYEKENEALVIFNKWEDAEEFMKHPEQLEVQNLEQQAVCCIEAQISDKYLLLIEDLDDLEENLKKSSGVCIDKSDQKKWILRGNLPQIELAHKYLLQRMPALKGNDQARIKKEQGNPQGSAVNSITTEGEKSEKYVPMSEKEYARFMALFQTSDVGSIENISYSKPQKCLRVSGCKSYTEHVENQAKKVITRAMDITDDIYELMKGDIMDLKRGSSPVFVFDETKGKFELCGMSQRAVDAAVKLLEQKKEKLMKQLKSKRSQSPANDHDAGKVQHSMERPSQSFSPWPSKTISHQGQRVYSLQSNFKILLYKGDILMSNVDAVCCGQDPFLKSKGRIASRIVNEHKHVEEQLKQEKKKRKYKNGEYIVSDCKFHGGKVIHVIFVVTESPASAKDSTKALESIKRCFKNVLYFAEYNHIKRLAMPLLGTGNTGALKSDVALKWFESVVEFLESKVSGETSNLREVHLVHKDDAWLEGKFDALVKQRFGTLV